MRCLIVDDDIICRKKVALILREVAECDDAVGGTEAIAKFKDAHRRNQPYDVVFLDILMPEVDGHETAKAIRQTEEELAISMGVKIVMITVLDSVNDAMKSFCQTQSSAYIVKPLTEEKLLNAFKNLEVF